LLYRDYGFELYFDDAATRSCIWKMLWVQWRLACVPGHALTIRYAEEGARTGRATWAR
jgi:hypothetical protein